MSSSCSLVCYDVSASFYHKKFAAANIMIGKEEIINKSVS